MSNPSDGCIKVERHVFVSNEEWEEWPVEDNSRHWHLLLQVMICLFQCNALLQGSLKKYEYDDVALYLC